MRIINRHGIKLVTLVAVGVALALILSFSQQNSQQAEATDGAVDFTLTIGPKGAPICTSVNGGDAKGDVLCSLTLNETFDANIQLADDGGFTNIFSWSAVWNWTAGLTGPGDPSSTKALTIHDCTGISASQAPFQAVPQTAKYVCVALPSPFGPGVAEGIVATAELTCGPTPSQETVTMVVNAANKANGTNVEDTNVGHSDLAPEVLTVFCGGVDTDNDGCTNAKELEPKSLASAGGGRDPDYFWDFFDTWATGSRTGNIDGFDIGDVVGRFGTVSNPPLTKEEALAEALTPPGDTTSYHASADRDTPDPEANVWNLGPPNGTIDGFDIGFVVFQFGHSCVVLP